MKKGKRNLIPTFKPKIIFSFLYELKKKVFLVLSNLRYDPSGTGPQLKIGHKLEGEMTPGQICLLRLEQMDFWAVFLQR